MDNKKFRLCKAKGFTLIEVIIAVSIVVILASLTVPKITSYIDKAKNAKVLNTGKQIYTAVMWSFSDQGNTINKTEILDAITDTLTDVTVSSVDNVASNVTVKFISDKAPHSVVIDTISSSYKID